MVPRGLDPEPLKMQMTVKARDDIGSKPKAATKKKTNKMDISLLIKKGKESINSVTSHRSGVLKLFWCRSCM